MSRLIDADELKKLFTDNLNESVRQVIAASVLNQIIDQQPTINEWHYPSKGDYPTDGDWYLVALEIGEDRRRCVVIGEYHATLTSPEKKWWVHGKEEHDVIAWMPLPEPPQEEV